MYWDDCDIAAHPVELQVKNSALIAGEMTTDSVFSHALRGENFYTFHVRVPRLSGTADTLPILMSERLMGCEWLQKGTELYVNGQIRSYNQYVPAENRNRLVLSVFAREYGFMRPEDNSGQNEVFLDGYLCKPAYCRETPFGRSVADLLVAVHRPYGRSDYIPCITWGRGAYYCATLQPGDHLQLWGRMQSRAYPKMTAEGSVERVAYEVSVSKLTCS